MSLRFYLRFASRTAADNALQCLDGYMLSDDSGSPVAPGQYPKGPGWHGYHIGPIVTAEATFSAGGAQLSAAVIDSRHHVNLLVETEAAQAALKAGVNRLRFRFPNSPKFTYQSGTDADADFLD